MNIALINKRTLICENVAVFEDIQTAIDMLGNQYILTEQTEGYGIGGIYQEGIWNKAEANPEKKEATQQDDLQNHKKNNLKGFCRWFGRRE